MKSPDQVLKALDGWLARNWQGAILDPTAHWPRRINLGAPSGVALEFSFSAALDWVHGWQDWALEHGLELKDVKRRAYSTSQSLPTHLIIPDLDTAVRLLGGIWGGRISTARARISTLSRRFPQADPIPLLRELTELAVVDFDLLLRAADWFRTHDAAGLTPRQVPIEGLDSKWLNTRQHLVLTLSGRQDLGLVRRPRTVHLTYLDPQHLHRGGRRYDALTEGDAGGPSYLPGTVVITENKDTALFFPPLERGIAIQGGGNAGPALIPRLRWTAGCGSILYWGDLDAEGFEIINQYRRRGLNVRSMLMDVATLEKYREFGVTHDRNGESLRRARKSLPLLTDEEQTAYRIVTDAHRDGPYRLEQERIPLNVAHALVQAVKSAGALTSLPLNPIAD